MNRAGFLPRVRGWRNWPPLLVMAFALGVRVWFGPQVRDDAYITLRYVQNLLAGDGFAYNPGEPVLGTSTPLFAILLTVPAALGADPTLAAVLLGIASDLASIALIYAIGVRAGSARAGLLAALLYSIAAPIVAYSVSGMETPLYTAMILAAFLTWDARRISTSGILIGALAVMRPEGILVGLTLIAASIRRWRRLPWRLIGWSALILVPWLLFASYYFGSPLPQSLLAKVDLGSEDRWISLRHLIIYFGDVKGRWFLLSTVAFVVGATTVTGKKPVIRYSLLWAAVYTSVFVLSNKFLFPIWPFEWYFLPLLAPYMLMAGLGLLRLGELIRFDARRWTLAAAVAILALYLPVLVQQREALVKLVRGRELLYVELARSMVEYGARQDMVAAPEIGALGYFYPGPILDTNGLVSPQAMGRSFSDLLQADRPPWIVSYDSLVPDDVLGAVWFEREYRPVRQLTNWEGRKATLFRRYALPEVKQERGLHLGALARIEDYQVGTQELSGRRLLHLRLIWQAKKPQSRRYTIFVHLVDGKGARLAQQDNEPQEGTRPTSSWKEGERILDLYDLSLPLDVDLGDLSLEVGAVRSESPSESLEWSSPAGTSLGPRLRLPVTQPGLPASSCEQRFGDGISLWGARIGVDGATDRIVVSLQWRALEPVSRDYTVFVHLLDDRGQIVAQHDGQPRAATFPTSAWLVKDVVQDEHVIPVQAGALSSIKRAAIGMYDLEAGRRLGLASQVNVDVVELPLPSPLQTAKPGAGASGDARELDLCFR